MADCMGKTITNCDPTTENCGSKYASFYYITLHIILNWILLNSFSAITVDTFITVLEEHDEIARLEKVWDKFNEQWIEYDNNKSGEVEFTDLINIYEQFELPKGAQWGNHERAKGLSATKPPIEELFKNIKIKNNKCYYNDVIFSFLNCWMGEELPESYIKKEKVEPKTGYEKKVILKSKEKLASSSYVPGNGSSNACFYFGDEDDYKDNGTPNQFNPIIRNNNPRRFSDKSSSGNGDNGLIVSSPSEMTTKSVDDDDEKTIDFKNVMFNDTFDNSQMNEFDHFEGEPSSGSGSNNKTDNSFSSTSDDSYNHHGNEKLLLNSKHTKFERMDSTRAYVFDNYSSEKNKKFKIPLKETFSETFSKGKAMLIPKSKYSSHHHVEVTSINNEEIPFPVVYNIYKLQHKFKNKKNQQYDNEIVIE